jgi:hypothetical protein
MVDFGLDAACVTDIDAMLTTVTGKQNVGQALARRFYTPRGGLFYDANYGMDLRSYLSSGMTDAEIRALDKEIEAESLKDERVQDCKTTLVVTMNGGVRGMLVTLDVLTAEGPFQFVLSVSAVSVELLKPGG